MGSCNRTSQQNTVYPIKDNSSWFVWRFVSGYKGVASSARRARSCSGRDSASQTRYWTVIRGCFPLRRMRPRFRESGTQPRVTRADIHHYARERQQRKRIQTYLHSLSTGAAGAWRTDGFQLRERASGFKMLLCASLCACSALGTNPAQLRLHNSL